MSSFCFSPLFLANYQWLQDARTTFPHLLILFVRELTWFRTVTRPRSRPLAALARSSRTARRRSVARPRPPSALVARRRRTIKSNLLALPRLLCLLVSLSCNVESGQQIYHNKQNSRTLRLNFTFPISLHCDCLWHPPRFGRGCPLCVSFMRGQGLLHHFITARNPTLVEARVVCCRTTLRTLHQIH